MLSLQITILLKKVLHHSLLFLCILNFQLPVKSRKMIWPSSNFQRMFSVPITVIYYCCFFKRLVVLRDEIIFVQKPHFWPKKCKIIMLTCSNNVFTIIVWDFIKIATKLQKLQLFSSIYPSEKLVKFQKVVTFAKCVQSPPLPKSFNCSNKKSIMMHVLSLFWSAVIT